MACILYRDGKAERVEARQVQNCLKNGYFATREESVGETPEVPVEAEPEVEATPEPEATPELPLEDDSEVAEEDNDDADEG